MKKYFVNTGYTGHLFEAEVLGECRLRWDGSYLPWSQAVQQVRTAQPWDPKSPAQYVPRELLQAVRREVNASDVEIFTSVGTALDRYHGVDGFFFFQGVMVTIDVTLRDKGQYKADLNFCEADMDDLGRFAKKVAEVLREKLARRALLARGRSAYRGV